MGPASRTTARPGEKRWAVSATPYPIAPEAAAPGLHLRLVPGHDHDWRLRSVDYDDGLEVRRYECASCEDVSFR